MVAYRKFRQLADDIDPTPIDEVKQKNMVEFKKYGEPDLLEVFMGDRPEEKGIIKPYAEHPLYIQKLNESARKGKDAAFGSEGQSADKTRKQNSAKIGFRVNGCLEKLVPNTRIDSQNETVLSKDEMDTNKL